MFQLNDEKTLIGGREITQSCNLMFRPFTITLASNEQVLLSRAMVRYLKFISRCGWYARFLLQQVD